MKSSKLIATMVAVAALVAGVGAPTAALAHEGRWDDGHRWGHSHGVVRGYYYAPRVVYPPVYVAPVVRYYRPPVVVYPAPVVAAPVVAAPYPVFPGGITFSFSAPLR